MARLTKVWDNSELYTVDDDKVNHDINGYSGEAIIRLAKFENIYDDLVASQIKIAAELETLRNEGKKNSVKFKELLGKKLMNSYIITIFKTNEL